MHYSPDITLFITLGIIFMILLAGVVRYCINQRRCRKALDDRVKALRIGKMLDHAGIAHARYLRRASPLTIEKHLLVCRQCKTTDICDECLEDGRDIPETVFCRNFRELIRYR